MALAGEIAVNVVARTRGYSAGLSRAKQETLGFRSAVSGTIGKIGSFIGVAGGLAGALLAASRAMRGLREQMTSIDEAVKLSKVLGLHHAQLIGLRNAAQLAGVSAGGLDTALQQMTRRVSEAATGTGEAKESLEELGLSAKSLISLGPYQTFLRLADAIKKVPNPMDRARLAYELFGRSGMGVVNMLNEGSEALDKFRVEAIKTGQALDVLSQRQIEEANDALSRAGQGWDALKTGLAVRFAPVLIGHGKTMEWIGKTVAGTSREYEDLHTVLGQVVPAMSAAQIGVRSSDVQRLIQEAKLKQEATKAREAEARAAKEQELSERKITEAIDKRQRFTGAAARGTTEAFSAIVQARSEQQAQLAIEKQQLVKQNEMAGDLKAISAHTQEMIRNMGVLVVQDLRS